MYLSWFAHSYILLGDFILLSKFFFIPYRNAYVKRVLDNVTSNILKYASKDSPVKIETGLENDMVFLSWENNVKKQDDQPDKTCIGISNIHVMMEKMGGVCSVRQTNDTFLIKLSFPVF